MVKSQNLTLFWWEDISWVELASSEVVAVKVQQNNSGISKQRPHGFQLFHSDGPHVTESRIVL